MIKKKILLSYMIFKESNDNELWDFIKKIIQKKEKTDIFCENLSNQTQITPVIYQNKYNLSLNNFIFVILKFKHLNYIRDICLFLYNQKQWKIITKNIDGYTIEENYNKKYFSLSERLNIIKNKVHNILGEI